MILHGLEKVTPRGSKDSGGGTQTIVVETYLDGREIAEAQVPHMPAVLKRHGLR